MQLNQMRLIRLKILEKYWVLRISIFAVYGLSLICSVIRFFALGDFSSDKCLEPIC